MTITAESTAPVALPRRTTHDLIIEAQRVLLVLLEAHGDADAPVPVESGDGWLPVGELLDALGKDVPLKVEALHAIATRAKGEAAQLREEVVRRTVHLEARAAAADAVETRCKESALALLLEARDLGLMEPKKDGATPTTLKLPNGSAWLQWSPAKVIGPEEPGEWPAKWRTEVTIVVPNKAAAKAALEAGETSTLVRLESKEGVRWR